VPQCPKGNNQKWPVSQPGIEALSHCPRFGTLCKNGLIMPYAVAPKTEPLATVSQEVAEYFVMYSDVYGVWSVNVM